MDLYVYRCIFYKYMYKYHTYIFIQYISMYNMDLYVYRYIFYKYMYEYHTYIQGVGVCDGDSTTYTQSNGGGGSNTLCPPNHAAFLRPRASGCETIYTHTHTHTHTYIS